MPARCSDPVYVGNIETPYSPYSNLSDSANSHNTAQQPTDFGQFWHRIVPVTVMYGVLYWT